MENKTKLGYLYNKTWETFKENFKLFAVILLIFNFLPITIHSIYSILNPFDDTLLVNQITGEINWGLLANYAVTNLLLSIVLVLISMFGGLLIIYFILKNPKTNKLSDLIKDAKKYYFKVIGALALIFLMLIPLYLFFIIPGVIFSVYFMFSQYLIVDRDEKIISSIKKSMRLVKGNWFKTFGKLFLTGIIFMIILVTISAFLSFIFLTIQGPSMLIEGLSTTNLIIHDVIINFSMIPLSLFLIIFIVKLYKGLLENYERANTKVKAKKKISEQ